MKDETHTFALIGEILKLSALNHSNRIMILEWCDALRSIDNNSERVSCGPLDPNSVKLSYGAANGEMHICTPPNLVKVTRVPRTVLTQFVNAVLTALSHTVIDTDALPKRLERLFMWLQETPVQPQATAPSLPADITKAQRVFYTRVWQHFRPDPFAVRRCPDSLLLLSRAQTQRLSMASGEILMEYGGHCIHDTHNRLYRVDDTGICHLNVSGEEQWFAPFDFETLSNTLHAYESSVLVTGSNGITSFDIGSGHLNWQVSTPVLTMQTMGKWIFSIDVSNGVAVHRRQYANPTHELIFHTSGSVVKHWWLGDYLIIFPTLRDDELCTHAFFINLLTSQTDSVRLPPLRPLSLSASSQFTTILLGHLNNRHLLFFNRFGQGIRLLKVDSINRPQHIVHSDDASLIFACSESALVSIHPDNLVHQWTRRFDDQSHIALPQSLMHEALLIAPGGPTLVIDARSGRTVSTIDEPLYGNARPLLVDQRRLLLHDEAGYLGQFQVQGHIGVADSNP